MTEPTNGAEPFAAWQRTVMEGMAAWQTVATPQAIAIAQAWQQTLAQHLATGARVGQAEQGPSATIEDWKRTVDQALELLGKAMADTMASEEFAALLGQAMQQYLHLAAPVRQQLQSSTEELFRMLNLPSRAQVTRLAKSVISVDERVESVDDHLEALQTQVTDLNERLMALQAALTAQLQRLHAERAPVPSSPAASQQQPRSRRRKEQP